MPSSVRARRPGLPTAWLSGSARRTAGPTVVTGLLALVGVLLALLGAAAPAAATSPGPGPGPGDGTSASGSRPVVLVGMTGIRWDDVRTLSTPALWDLSRDGGVGAVAARSIASAACPADGWLAVSAGTRLADLTVPDRGCRTLRHPGPDGSVHGWADYIAAGEEQPFGAAPGVLGDILAEAGTPVAGIGPGAAIALADADGTVVGTFARRPGTATELQTTVRDALETAELVVVDVGTVREPGNATEGRPDTVPTTDPDTGEEVEEEEALTGVPDDDEPSGVDAIVEPTRVEQVMAVDARVEAVVRAAAPYGATVLVVSLADSGRTALQLAVATGTGPDGQPYDASLLTSGSTRQAGLLQTTDVTPTLVAALGLEDPAGTFVGAPIVATAGPATSNARVDRLEDIAAEARQVTRVSGSYLTRLVLTQAVLFVVAALMLSAVGRPREPHRRPAFRALQIASLALGAAPIASFLTGLVPWWRAGAPTMAFWGVLLLWMALITAAAVAGPWRTRVLGPAGVVAGVTVLVLVLDAVTGSSLVVDSPMGAHRIMAARFYGMSNQAFALLAAAGLLLATALAQPLVARGRRGQATAVVVAIGVVITVVDGAPGWGSDFGGPPALILSFAVLALVVSGRPPRWRTLLLIMVIGGLVVFGVALLDWLRPPADRTHLGRFFATVIDGGLWDVVVRKLSVNLRVLTSWRYLVLAIGGMLVTVLVLRGPHPTGASMLRGRSPLAGLGQQVPLLATCVTAVGIALGIGFLINDSGIVVPATGIAVAVPCLIAAAAQHRLQHPEEALAVAEGTAPAQG